MVCDKLSIWDVVLGAVFVAAPVGCDMNKTLGFGNQGCGGYGDAQPTGEAAQAAMPATASIEEVTASCADGTLVAPDCVAVLRAYAELADEQGCGDEHAALVACAADVAQRTPARESGWRCDAATRVMRACLGEDADVDGAAE